jgi:hypothetical protein
MKKVTFHFKLESVGSLEYVRFFPEDSEDSIPIKTDDDRKVWECESFDFDVENPFQYVLVVVGVSGTSWKAFLKIITDEGERDFLEWEGKTGDTAKNVSRRTTPIRNI